MSGFGIDPFSQFADEPDATEDPFGIAAAARETQWWTPYGSVAPRRKKRSGLDGWNQEGPPPSYVRPPAAMTPSPSATQRVILDQKQGQEDAARLFGGGAGSDSDYLNRTLDSAQNQLDGGINLNGGGVLKYQAPDPTNPGQQDQARSATVDNAALDEWRESMKKAKELEDQALALPNRTGFWGKYDEQRGRLYEGARVLRQRAAYAAASAPGAAPSYDPNRYKTVGNLVFDAASGQYVVPDENTMAAMHRSGLTPRTGATRTPAPQKPFPVGKDDRLVVQDPNDPQVLLPAGEKVAGFGPPTPGARPGSEWPSGIKQETASKNASVRAAEIRATADAEGGDEDGADDEPDPVKVQAAHNNIDARFDRRLDQARDPKARAQIEAERKKAHDEADVRLAPKKKKGAAGGGGLGLTPAQVQAIKNGPKGKIAVVNGRRYRATASGVEEVAR